MSARLTALPGGRDSQPHADRTVRPPSAMDRFRVDFDHACVPLSRALADHGGHVHDLRPTAQAVASGHPSTMAPYDHTDDPDRPAVPWLVRQALRVLTGAVATPGSVDRPHQVEAALIVVDHFGLDGDDCKAHQRPQGDAS